MGNIAERWRELSGENKWEGLLDPPDTDLCRYVIHYGERVQATMDAYNRLTTSKWFGFSRYPPDDSFFSKVGLEKANPFKYKVTKFFYARAEIEVLDWVAAGEPSWMGYVAVATEEGKVALGRRDILVAWRGTMTGIEAVVDMQADLVVADDVLGPVGDPKVHRGWLAVYTSESSESVFNNFSARKQVLNEVRRLVDLYQGEEISISITGHSMGAAIATLNAVDIAANGYNKPTDNPDDKGCLVTAIAFASPRVGDAGFNHTISRLPNLHILRIQNAADIIPTLPPLLYTHVGEELRIDTGKSPFLKSADLITNFMIGHQMEVYLHGVAGTQGRDGGFELSVKRDISLLNKYVDVVKKEYLVPAEWWVERNKGMVQEEDGSWKLVEYVPDPPV